MHLLVAGALAFVAGIVFGIFGAGGSILLVPILVYVLGVSVKSALGMSLLILMLTGGFATGAHARSLNVSWWIGLRWAALGMVGAYAGGRVAEFIPGEVLLLAFAAVVVTAALAMIRRSVPTSHADPRRVPMGKVVMVGTVLGFFTGMIGVGGGFLLVPALVLVCGIDVKLAIGTSLLIISINSLGGFLGFASHEPIPWRLAFTVAAFNAAGSLLGERLGKPLPAYRLRPAFGLFLLIVGAAMVVENLVDLFSKTH
jgi:uncharacterized membrane protein YfcA